MSLDLEPRASDWTLWSGEVLLGRVVTAWPVEPVSALDPNAITGAFYPTAAGERVLPVFDAAFEAMQHIVPKIDPLLPDDQVSNQALSKSAADALRTPGVRQRIGETLADIEKLHLQLRCDDGSVFQARNIMITDNARIIPGLDEMPEEVRLRILGPDFPRYVIRAVPLKAF